MSADARVELRTAATRLQASEIIAIEIDTSRGRELWPIDAAPLVAWLEYEADNLDEWFNVGALQRGVTERSNLGRDAARILARAVLASQQQETQPPTEEAR